MANASAIGNQAGHKLVTLAASTTYYFGRFLLAPVPSNYTYLGWPFGWKTFMFQLVPGNATLGNVTVNGTLDQNTATQASGNLGAWEPLPAPSAGGNASYTNPMTPNPGQRLLYVNSGPFCGFSVSVDSTYNGTTGYLLFGATA